MVLSTQRSVIVGHQLIHKRLVFKSYPKRNYKQNVVKIRPELFANILLKDRDKQMRSNTRFR